MFNTEKAISEWRQQMLRGGIKAPVPLDELENHLREEIERQVKSGMDAEAAFESASRKIGAAEPLKSEFEKAAKDARVVKEARTMQIVSLFAVAGFAMFIGTLLFFRIGNFSELTSNQQMSGYAALSLMLLFGFSGRLGYKFFPKIGRKKIRDVICISAGVILVLWWTILFWVVLPRHEYTLAQLCLLVTWGFAMPFGIMLGLCTSIAAAARKSVLFNA